MAAVAQNHRLPDDLKQASQVESVRTAPSIREAFMDYYQARGFTPISGSSVLPKNDPTLLLINSGMAPLKSYFTGAEQSPSSKLCNIQTCIRTNDIESIGDDYHLTCFEMMGNWTIGALSKAEAIKDAWTLISQVFKLTDQKIVATYFGGDDALPGVTADHESKKIWHDLGFAESDVYALGSADNFWGPAGDEGPCGPCTEVFVDRGEQFAQKPGEKPDAPSGRFIEIWNPGVFMVYQMDRSRALTDLPFPNLDAGAGVERWCMILQNVNSVYEIDSIRPVMDVFLSHSTLTPKDRAARIMTDHIRTAAVLIAEGISPSNQREGYVLRRLLRRAITQADLKGVDLETLQTAAATAIDSFSHKYRVDSALLQTLIKVIGDEKAQFGRMLERGKKALGVLVGRIKGDVISGSDIFDLKQSLGLPVEVASDILQEHGKSIELNSYYQAEAEHQTKSKKQ